MILLFIISYFNTISDSLSNILSIEYVVFIFNWSTLAIFFSRLIIHWSVFNWYWNNWTWNKSGCDKLLFVFMILSFFQKSVLNFVMEQILLINNESNPKSSKSLFLIFSFNLFKSKNISKFKFILFVDAYALLYELL